MRFANFIPYGMKISEIRVTSYDNKIMTGMMINPLFYDPQSFHGVVQLLLLLEKMQDALNYPEQAVELRTFHKRPPSANPGPPTAVGSGHPVLATFLVNVCFRQNASWQGTLLWKEQDSEASFRSVFELIKLMDSVLGS